MPTWCRVFPSHSQILVCFGLMNSASFILMIPWDPTSTHNWWPSIFAECSQTQHWDWFWTCIILVNTTYHYLVNYREPILCNWSATRGSFSDPNRQPAGGIRLRQILRCLGIFADLSLGPVLVKASIGAQLDPFCIHSGKATRNCESLCSSKQSQI